MIAKPFRLSRNEIEWVLKKGKSLSTNLFLVRFQGIPEGKNSKFAVIVSAKFSPKAVERNKVRRRIYEAVRLNLKGNIKYMLALIPKKKILFKEYIEIEEDIKNLFSLLEKNG